MEGGERAIPNTDGCKTVKEPTGYVQHKTVSKSHREKNIDRGTHTELVDQIYRVISNTPTSYAGRSARICRGEKEAGWGGSRGRNKREKITND